MRRLTIVLLALGLVAVSPPALRAQTSRSAPPAPKAPAATPAPAPAATPAPAASPTPPAPAAPRAAETAAPTTIVAPPAAPAKPGEAPKPVQKVTLYSAFEPARLKPVFADFSKDSGITIELQSDMPDILLGRLLREGAATSADLILMPNLTRFDRAATAGLLQPRAVPALEEAVPPAYRDPSARWFGVASFARGVAYRTDKVKPGEIVHYEDLAKPQWKGRLCIPPIDRPGNRTLFASLVLHDGAVAAEQWIQAVGANAVALPPPEGKPEIDGDDRPLIRALGAGKCDAAMIGSRTLARLADRGDDKDKAILDQLAVVWPNQDTSGTQVDIVGVALTGGADKREPALKVMAYLASDTGQRLLAEALWAYPIKPGVPLSNPVTRWGPFKADETPLSTLLPLLEQAADLADHANWPPPPL
jgi:iron(III) transport system substrate-binding protein